MDAGQQATLECMGGLRQVALKALRGRVLGADGRVSGELLREHQVAVHGLAYLFTEVEACFSLSRWCDRLPDGSERQLGTALTRAYVSETARGLMGGVSLGACETVSLWDLGVTPEALGAFGAEGVVSFVREFGGVQHARALWSLIKERGGGAYLPGEGLDEVRREFARFSDARVMPLAQGIHRRDQFIPMDLVKEMADLGVFGLTVPNSYGGLGMGKVAMCVVTEELTRGYIGVGSLGTRSEIAAELILGGGTDAQKSRWLPGIAGGDVLPTAVFTEPNHGSDLASLQTRAAPADGGGYVLSGQKTWITHAVRADLMTVLARTGPTGSGYRGLSMFLVEKTRRDGEQGTAEFVDPGLTGTEIKVLGYRGMKEHELSFDRYPVPEEALLGRQPGAGFKQLMRTFESARIQTAARGVGLAQAALDDGIRYASERRQFGMPIEGFPRVWRKVVRMAALTQASRQLTYDAARQKDSGRRCDLEAGMSKLLATRAAWQVADANVQIHGGNGYAEEYTASRLLVDARVLSIFEGANEIQAEVVAKRLLES